MPRIANCIAKNYVNSREPFRGNNTYGELLANGSYVVYSYGPHWPLYLWFSPTSGWYGNPEKYSRTTSRHANQLRPRDVPIRHIDKLHMLELIRFCNNIFVEAAMRMAGLATTTREAASRAFELESWQHLQRQGVRTLSAPVPGFAQIQLPQPPRVEGWQPPGPRRLQPLKR